MSRVTGALQAFLILLSVLLWTGAPGGLAKATIGIEDAAEKLAVIRLLMPEPTVATPLSKFGQLGYKWDQEQIFVGSSPPEERVHSTELQIYLTKNAGEKIDKKQLTFFFEWNKKTNQVSGIRHRVK